MRRVKPFRRLWARASGWLDYLQYGRHLRQYQKLAEDRGLGNVCEADIWQQVRARLQGRGEKRWPRAQGDLHIFLAYYLSNWESVLPQAFSTFGPVSTFEWRSRGFNDEGAEWPDKRDDMNRAMLAEFRRVSEREPIDVVIGYLSGHNTSAETVFQMAQNGAAVLNFCWDDKLRFPGRKVGGRFPSPAGIAHAVDLNVTNAPDSVAKYLVHGGLAVFAPEAAHPAIHRPFDLAFEYDITFIGNANGWRPFFMEELKHAGLGVECFGCGWPNGVLDDDDLVKMVSRSRINLGLGFNGNVRRLLSLKGRDFEVPMCGGLYLTQDNPELRLVYDVGQEIVTFSKPLDCARVAHELLEDPTRAEAIRRAGRRRALTEHTYEARWGRILRRAGLLQ